MIVLCVPTRGRPSLFRDMAASAFRTADVPDRVLVVAYIADDDPTADFYPYDSSDLALLRGPRVWNTVAWNTCMRHGRDNGGDIFMQAADDLVFRTQGWDTWLDAVFAGHRAQSDPYWLVHCADGSPHDAPTAREYVGVPKVFYQPFAAHVILSREWIDEVGYLVPEQVPSTFSDVWVNELADRLSRRHFLPDVRIEHMHSDLGKRMRDYTDDLRRLTDRCYQPQRIYAETRTLRDIDVMKLRTAIMEAEHART